MRRAPSKVIQIAFLLGLVIASSLVLLPAPARGALATEYAVRSWHVADGLPDGSVTALAQTPDGYLWVGTRKGLVRFDGSRFSKAGTDGEHGLVDLRIRSLLAARDGSLWILSERGVVMQVRHGKYEPRYLPGPMAQSVSTARQAGRAAQENPPGDLVAWNDANLFAEDKVGHVWTIADNSTLLCFDSHGQRLPVVTNSLPGGTYRGISSGATGEVWLAKGESLCRFTEASWQVFPMPEDVLGEVPLMCSDSADGISIVNTGGGGERTILQFTTLGRGASLKVSARNQISAFLRDRANRIWLSDWWGGVRARRPGAANDWELVGQKSPLAKCVVTCLREDAHGAIWVGTVGEGLHQLTPQQVTMQRPPSESLDAAVTAVSAARDGSLWLGTAGSGITRWMPDGMVRYGTNDGLFVNNVDAIAEDKLGRVWVTTGGAISVFDGRRFHAVPELSGALAMVSDREGDFWLGGASRVVHLHGGTNATAYFAADRRSLDIRNLAFDQSGRLWIAVFNSGLWQLRDATLVPVNNEIGFARTDARSLLCDRDGIIWIGTLNGGLFRWDGKRLKHFLMLDGFPDDSIIGMAEDEAGTLWMASANGVFGCSRASLAAHERGKSPTLSCWQLNEGDGLANRGCSGGGQSVITRDTNGMFWVANMLGAAGFNPTDITRKRWATNIVVEAVLADGVELESVDGEFRVSTSARRFEFRFTTPELQSPRLLHFRHRLEGVDRDWVDAGMERSASYSRLAGGQYRFRVMVRGGDGEWHEGEEVAKLRVVPHYWELRWVQALALVLFIGAIGGGIAWNERRKLQLRLERLEMQHAVEKERTRIARDIHDQLGASLTQIALMSEAVPGDAPAREHADNQLARVAAKARSVVQMLNGIVWAVNPKNDNLPKLLDHLCSMSEELCETAGVRCWHEVPTSPPSTPLQPEVRHNISLSVREAVNNGLKHSGASAIWVRAAIENALLRVEVEDDGRGFDFEPARARGNGLNNIRARIEQLGGRADFLSRPGAGTKVRIETPLPG